MSEEVEEEQHDCDCPPPGLPAYMGTFADLMSLLMCFFVLLLSFAEMDALKYKMVVKSLENAFGVQREVAANDIPKGTSIIAQEFSPGDPKPTPLKQVRQETIDETRDALKVVLDKKEAQEAQ
jgi:chemotaxis protein MotB